MTGGQSAKNWPRLGAHLGVLAAIGVIWGLPQARPPVLSVRAEKVAVAEVPAANPRQVSPRPSPVPTSLPNAAAAVLQLLPVPPALRPGHHATPAPKKASPPGPPNGWGSDISWPQCGGGYPGTQNVRVVGVTGGRPFSGNPCLGNEWGWARGASFAGGAQAYLNLEIDGTSTGPHRCGADDHVCRAYDYGYISALEAMARAGGQGIRPDFWWLDVEVGNYWSDVDPGLNARTVQGAIDAFLQRGYPVGIYSSVDQWAQIMPDSYHPGIPTWLAVVGDAASVGSLCSPSHSLTGGPVLMVQYDDHFFDWDFVCPAGTVAFAAAGARNHR